MTFATIDSREITKTKSNTIAKFVTAVSGRINVFRAERKELRKIYSHHTETNAILARGQRDVNRVWY